jgi:hypothetical protein
LRRQHLQNDPKELRILNNYILHCLGELAKMMVMFYLSIVQFSLWVSVALGHLTITSATEELNF